MFKFTILFVILLIKTAHPINAKNHFILNEKNLSKLLKNKNPTLEKINLIYEISILNKLKFNENFSYNLSAGYSSLSSNDEGNKIYDTQIYTNTQQFNVGINKNSVFGMNFGVNFQSGEYGMNMPINNRYDFNYSKSGVKITYGIDLWKNFLGYQTYNKEISLKLSQKQNKVKQKIELNNYYYSSRQLYWQMYTKKEEIVLYEDMVVQAQKMYENVKKMYSSYLVDKRDIARAEANLEMKKFNLNSAKLEFVNLEKSFKQLFPDLIEKNIVLSNINIKNFLDEVKNCNLIINNENSSWEKSTSYVEYIKYMDDVFRSEEKMLERYSDIDIKLNLEADFRGTEKDYSNSIKDMKKFDRNDYRVSLNFNKAIDGSVKESKQQQLKIVKMNFNINKNETLSNIKSFYYSYDDMMKNLFLMQENISKSKYNMEIRVKEGQDKYNKGRISLNDLISDNDNLIQNNINLIKINTNIINMSIQYLSVFDKVVCNLVLK